MDNQEPKHQRRPRYKGTHPKAYKDKYKELQPEKYADTVEKVMQKGSTPAGMHRSICVNEILDFLAIKPGQIGLDATLGFGGHTKAMLQCLEGQGHLYATDVDAIELPRTQKRLEDNGYEPEILTIRHLNFSQIDEIARESGPLDFVLADLGVSSNAD
jgi:Predicted S-adenosylmethionine-dependent methyltransferase involved in cell envelope biogenesis